MAGKLVKAKAYEKYIFEEKKKKFFSIINFY